MSIDEVRFAQAVAQERRRRRVNQLVILLIAIVVCSALAFVFVSAAGITGSRRLLLAVAGGVIGAVVIVGGVTAAGAIGQRAVQGVLEPGGRGRDRAVHSHAEALAASGDFVAASAAFDQVRAQHGDTAALLRAEADVQLRQDGNAERARELLMRLRKAADATRADELYATHRLIDLYLGPLSDEARGMGELRRLADRFPGTRDAEGAQAEWQRRRDANKHQHDTDSSRLGRTDMT